LSGCNEKLELPRVLWLAGFLKLKAEVERDCSLGMADDHARSATADTAPDPFLPKDRSLADTQSCSKIFAQTQMWRVYFGQ